MTSLPRFQRDALLTQALTHSSYCNEHPEATEDNERLEFLGDAVLKFVMGKLLYEQFPQLREGELSRLRAGLENNRHQLASFATDLGLDKMLRFGKGTAKVGARENPEILSDAFEAVVGAYFLDAGIEAAIAFVEELVTPIAKELVAKPDLVVSQNAKGALQEWAVAHVGEVPKYRTISEVGADHEKLFTVAVDLQGREYGQGQAKSKKLAQKAAAQAALKKIATPQPAATSPETDQGYGDRLTLLQQLAHQNTL